MSLVDLCIDIVLVEFQIFISDFFKKNSEFHKYETRSVDLYSYSICFTWSWQDWNTISWSNHLEFYIEEWSNFRYRWGHIWEIVEKLVHNSSLSVPIWFWLICTMFNLCTELPIDAVSRSYYQWVWRCIICIYHNLNHVPHQPTCLSLV